MISTAEAVKHLSIGLGMNEDVLVREAIAEYIKFRIKVCMWDRLDILSKYQVYSLEEFEKGVQDGSVHEHPGWEDLIILENIENSINKLRTELSHVKDVSIA